MTQIISVRIPALELNEIESISRVEKRKKSEILREVLDKGIKEKKLEIALEKFQHNEATAWKSAKIAGIPLTQFLDILVKRGIDFHYGTKELREDFEGLI